ncbi:MAG TPA: site-specific integrase [Puia sp.]|nr:site-specific integrase [Puia sp.]
MVNKTFSLLFYLKKRSNYVKGRMPIYIRITVDTQRAELSTKRYCDDPDKWNASAGRIKGINENAKLLNAYLDTLQSKVYDALRFFVERDEIITAEKIKDKLIGIKEHPKKILEIFLQHNDQIKALIGKSYAALTLKRYNTALEHTREFISWKYHLPDIDIKKLNYEFIAEYDFYLKGVRKCGHNSTMKYLSNLKKVVLLCLKKGWLLRDPFYGFNLATKEVVREILTNDELSAIASKQFLTERLNITRDIFLFSCYTGLAYVDVYNLERSAIVNGIDDEKWIYSNRQKTETPFRIPLLPVTLEILERYKNHPQCQNNGKVLPVWSNQKLNEYLKEIADVCGISKRLTYHMARHTFATTVTLNNGVPIETVSKMLGHKSIKITQHYAKTQDRKVSDDMKLLRNKLDIKKITEM